MGDQANYGREILKRQLLALTKNPPEGISVGLADDDDMYTWEVMIIGPDGTLYEGGMYLAVPYLAFISSGAILGAFSASFVGSDRPRFRNSTIGFCGLSPGSDEAHIDTERFPTL